MKGLFARLFGGDRDEQHAAATPASAPGIACAGARELDLRSVCRAYQGLPHPEWEAVDAWLDTLAEADRPAAWTSCERAWLELLAAGLGDGYRLVESEHAFVLSRQPANEAAATLAYVGRSFLRVQRMLEELAQKSDGGKEILLLFPDHPEYCRYLGAFHPEEEGVPVSAGMYLHGPCGHFVVHGEEMWRFEPTIVHEMTHSLLAHLPIPAWLNEGMAVNSEQRLTRVGSDIWSVLELEDKHRRFWTPATIQEFWNGAAYLRSDDGQELAYDLGRILVNGMCGDWAGFKRFAAQAHAADGGDAAARECLDLDLGEFVRHFLQAAPGDWGPRPGSWRREPERGAFAPR